MRGATPRLGDPLARSPKRLSQQSKRERRSSEVSPHEGSAAISGDPRKDVVAVVLSDGTVQCIAEPTARSSGGGFRKGQVAGPRWTLWWELRFWSP